MNFDIDYVFPYVNNGEPVWQQSFIDYCKRKGKEEKIKSINGERYNDMGLLPILVKCVKTNMPWIRKIHIIVSNIEQLPKEIIDDERVNVVLHRDIIPNKFLPTFNSTTIEMFVPRIKDLAEHFIYGNDDMYPINPLEPSQFFTEDGKSILINLHREVLKLIPSQFRKVCWNNNRLIIKSFKIETKLSEKEYYRPYHSITPCIKSNCIEVLDKCKDKIYENIRAFRTDKQVNQYIYPVYEKFNGRVQDTSIRFKYVSNKNPLNSICEEILNKNSDVICINDNAGAYRSEVVAGKEKIKESFNKRLENN